MIFRMVSLFACPSDQLNEVHASVEQARSEEVEDSRLLQRLPPSVVRASRRVSEVET